MGMGTAIMACLEKFMIFTGRATRREFWWFFIAWLVVSILGSFLELALQTKMISIGIQVAFLMPTVAAGARRLHDTGRPGYLMLIPFASIPFLLIGPAFWGLAMLLTLAFTLVLLAMPGQRGPNKYGDDPRLLPDLGAFD